MASDTFRLFVLQPNVDSPHGETSIVRLHGDGYIWEVVLDSNGVQYAQGYGDIRDGTQGEVFHSVQEYAQYLIGELGYLEVDPSLHADQFVQ